MTKQVAIVTHVTKYAGPSAIEALKEKYIVVGHDEEFTDLSLKQKYQELYPKMIIKHMKSLEKLIQDVMTQFGRIDLIVNNDVFPLQYKYIENSETSDIRETLENLVVKPFSLLSQVVPIMKKQEKGYVIFITSAAPNHPETGFSIYCSARSATTTLAQAAANELASSNIMVYAIAPNYFESETYYPKELWFADEGKKKLQTLLPLGRLGTKREMGALISYLSSGTADFLTGEVFNFTGGW